MKYANEIFAFSGLVVWIFLVCGIAAVDEGLFYATYWSSGTRWYEKRSVSTRFTHSQKIQGILWLERILG